MRCTGRPSEEKERGHGVTLVQASANWHALPLAAWACQHCDDSRVSQMKVHTSRCGDLSLTLLSTCSRGVFLVAMSATSWSPINSGSFSSRVCNVSDPDARRLPIDHLRIATSPVKSHTMPRSKAACVVPSSLVFVAPHQNGRSLHFTSLGESCACAKRSQAPCKRQFALCRGAAESEETNVHAFCLPARVASARTQCGSHPCLLSCALSR